IRCGPTTGQRMKTHCPPLHCCLRMSGVNVTVPSSPGLHGPETAPPPPIWPGGLGGLFTASNTSAQCCDHGDHVPSFQTVAPRAWTYLSVPHHTICGFLGSAFGSGAGASVYGFG